MSHRNWSALPSRAALLLGIGTAAAGSPAEAAVAAPAPAQAQQQIGQSGAPVVWTEQGRVLISEDGKDARELPLGDTREARLLRELLQRRGAVTKEFGARLGPLMLAGGGGDGFHWAPPSLGAKSPPATGAGAKPAASTAPPRPVSSGGASALPGGRAPGTN